MQDEEYEQKRDSLIFEALGAASVCWENPGGAGIFDSDRAKEVGEKLVGDLAALEDDRTLWRVLHKGEGNIGVEVSPQTADGMPTPLLYLAIGRALHELGDLLIENAITSGMEDDDL